MIPMPSQSSFRCSVIKGWLGSQESFGLLDLTRTFKIKPALCALRQTYNSQISTWTTSTRRHSWQHGVTSCIAAPSMAIPKSCASSARLAMSIGKTSHSVFKVCKTGHGFKGRFSAHSHSRMLMTFPTSEDNIFKILAVSRSLM